MKGRAAVLIVGRKEGTGLWIGSDIHVGIHSIRGSHVRVSINAPHSVGIFRDELLGSAPPDPDSGRAEESLRVLLIDAEETYAIATMRALRTAGATPVGHLPSLDKIDRWSEREPAGTEERPDLLLVDAGGRGLGGAALIRTLRGHHWLATIPIVVLSCAESHAFIDKCMEAGANAFLIKPENLSDLMVSVRRVVDFWSTSLQGQHLAEAAGRARAGTLDAGSENGGKTSKSRRKTG